MTVPAVKLKWRREYAAQKGLELDEDLTFEDLGVSAYHSKNAKAGALRAFPRRCRVRSSSTREAIYWWKAWTRISRAESDHDQLKGSSWRSWTNDVTLVTLIDGKAIQCRESVITPIPCTLIMILANDARAHEESATKARRLKAAWESKRARRMTNQSQQRSPGWLELDKETGTFKVIEDRANVVRRVFEMTLAGMGQNAIAETFNREGVPCFGRGKHWHRSYIAKLLGNPSVYGQMTPHKLQHKDGKTFRKPLEPIEDYYPAIVDKDTYHSVQALRTGSKAPLRGRHAGKQLRNIFGGLCKCPLCGSTMTLVNKGKGAVRLVCSKAKAGAGCKYISVHYDAIERTFLKDYKVILGNVPVNGNGDGSLEDEIEHNQASIDVTEEALGRLLDALQSGTGSSTVVMERISALESNLEDLKKQREELLKRYELSMSKLVVKKLDDLEETLAKGQLDKMQVNSILRQLLSSVVIDYRSGELVFNWQHGGETRAVFMWPKVEDILVHSFNFLEWFIKLVRLNPHILLGIFFCSLILLFFPSNWLSSIGLSRPSVGILSVCSFVVISIQWVTKQRDSKKRSLN